MPREPKQYRLETETIAEIDLYSRLQRLEYTTFVEQAVMERIRQAKKDTGIDSHEITRVAGQNGAVLLRLFIMAERKVTLTWTPEEEKMRQFVRRHAVFFYNDRDEPRDEAMRFIWPQLGAIMAEWSGDYWRPGRTMQEVYRKNGIEPPQWPPKNEATRENDGEGGR